MLFVGILDSLFELFRVSARPGLDSTTNKERRKEEIEEKTERGTGETMREKSCLQNNFKEKNKQTKTDFNEKYRICFITCATGQTTHTQQDELNKTHC